MKLLTASLLAVVTAASVSPLQAVSVSAGDGSGTFLNYTTLGSQTTQLGTFYSSRVDLDQYSSLQGGSYAHDYAYTIFTPDVSGYYNIGILSYPGDPVIIGYRQTTIPDNIRRNQLLRVDFPPDFDGFNSYLLGAYGSNFQLQDDQMPYETELWMSTDTSYLLLAAPYWGEYTLGLPVTFFVEGAGTGKFLGEATVPEPSTYGLIGIGALGVAFAARRRKAKVA